MRSTGQFVPKKARSAPNASMHESTQGRSEATVQVWSPIPSPEIFTTVLSGSPPARGSRTQSSGSRMSRKWTCGR